MEDKNVLASNDIFQERLAHHLDELKWLYMELYDNDDIGWGLDFAELPWNVIKID